MIHMVDSYRRGQSNDSKVRQASVATHLGCSQKHRNHEMELNGIKNILM